MKIKNYFLDNNVIIGFIYKLDNLNPDSENIVNSGNNLYYSYHVKSEINDVSNRKNNEYNKFFSLLLSKLRKHNQHQFISRTDFHLFIDKSGSISKMTVENMHYAFDRIWDALGFGENQEADEIKLKLRRFKVAFGKTHASRKTNFLKTANYIPAHRHKDQQIISMVNAKSLGDSLHGEDEKILFDLQEYSRNHPELNMILVSWDKTFIKVVKEIKSVLSFNECISLDGQIIL